MRLIHGYTAWAIALPEYAGIRPFLGPRAWSNADWSDGHEIRCFQNRAAARRALETWRAHSELRRKTRVKLVKVSVSVMAVETDLTPAPGSV